MMETGMYILHRHVSRKKKRKEQIPRIKRKPSLATSPPQPSHAKKTCTGQPYQGWLDLIMPPRISRNSLNRRYSSYSSCSCRLPSTRFRSLSIRLVFEKSLRGTYMSVAKSRRKPTKAGGWRSAVEGLHVSGLHSHCRSLGEARRPIMMPSTATQTPTRVKMASLDHAVDASTGNTSCPGDGTILRGLALMLVANRSRYRTCAGDRVII